MLYIASSEAVVHIHRCWMMKAGKTQLHMCIMVQQPMLYIASSEAIMHTHMYWIMTAGNTQPIYLY